MAVHILNTNEQKKSSVLASFEAMQKWSYFEEVFLNCVKESPLSYEAFAHAVANGDASHAAFDRAMQESQMTRDEFNYFLPEFLKFMALCREYRDVAMLSDGVDQIWHAFYLLDRYDVFCREFLGFKLMHLPCSLYPLYGIEVPTSSCVEKCVPSTCKGDGGGCSSKLNDLRRDTDPPELTKQRILDGRRTFVQAYTFVFDMSPDVAIWNQLARGCV
jgi:hypothetical protein